MRSTSRSTRPAWQDHDLRRDLLDAYRSLECYPEVTRVLEALRDGGMRTAILSNGSRANARRGGHERGDRNPP